MSNTVEQNTHKAKRRSAEAKVVLIVDDTEDMLDLNRTILELEGFKVFTALGGQEALNILSEISPPNLILLDLKMKDVSGPDFLKLLEVRMPDIIEKVPIVFLSAMNEVPSSKAVGFIRKPIEDIKEFALTVRRFIETGTGRPGYKH
jgi:CheY-like chemotaxis protein